MSLNSLVKYIFVCFLILSLTSVNQWSPLPILNSQVERVVMFTALALILTFIFRQQDFFLSKVYLPISAFSLWALLGLVRGLFVADCYWEFNQLTIGTMSLSLPLLCFLFEDPNDQSHFYHLWLKICIPLFFVFFFWIVGPSQFYLAPVFFIACFFPLLSSRWKWIVMIILILLSTRLSDRAQIIKVVFSLLISVGIYYRYNLSNCWLRVLHWSFYVIALLLLYLGVTGTYNVFQDGLGSFQGRYVVNSDNKKVSEREDLSEDTRTFIYFEVIQSAIRHEYVLFGRTPARGNDCFSWGDLEAKYGKNYRKSIRYMNEVCMPNIFTWLGVIGLVLYSFVYLRSSWLAIYKSNSVYMKFVGCFIAFHWLLGWIEDMNLFNIYNISLWMVIAMGYSCYFRTMNDEDFEDWIQSIFTK